MKGIFVTGTDTDVGKTWVGEQLIRTFERNGVNVVPRKPVESGWPEDIAQSDAWLLANAAGKTNLLDQICPNRFMRALSPERAASLEGISLHLDLIHKQCIEHLKDADFLYVEGAGGFYSPLCHQGLNADLAELLGLPVLLVVDNYLGCINHTLLTIEAIKNRKLSLVAVVLNNASLDSVVDMNNYEDLKYLTAVPIIKIDNKEESSHPFETLYNIINKFL